MDVVERGVVAVVALDDPFEFAAATQGREEECCLVIEREVVAWREDPRQLLGRSEVDIGHLESRIVEAVEVDQVRLQDGVVDLAIVDSPDQLLALDACHLPPLQVWQ